MEDAKILMIIAFVTVFCIGSGLYGCPQYGVYYSEMSGKAQYVQAEQNRRIKVLEAQAELDSAKLTNQAEIERAKGIAEANKIVGDSLKGNEEYLRYLWINNLKDNGADIIYIPTEAGLPILEAGKKAE